MTALSGRVEEEIEKIVASEGLELVHVEYRQQGRGWLLRIDIDKEGGVMLADCELVSHQVSAFLDVEDVVPAEYELQVSSPGLDRKFYKESDYQKFIGRLVRVRTSTAIRGLHVIVGRLELLPASGHRRTGIRHTLRNALTSSTRNAARSPSSTTPLFSMT